MIKELIISSHRHETKVALLEDDQLVEIFFQRANEYSLAGSIHKGRVTRVLPGMQSAFVNIGLERDAFLYVSDFLEEGGEDYERLGSGDDRPRGEDRQRGERRGGGSRSAPPAEARSGEVKPPAEAKSADSRQGEARQVDGRQGDAKQSDETSERAGENGSSANADDRRGGRRRRRRGRGRGFPESKYAGGNTEEASGREDDSEPEVLEASESAEPEADFADLVLPGESLAKYRRPASTDATAVEPDAGEAAAMEAAEASAEIAEDTAEDEIEDMQAIAEAAVEKLEAAEAAIAGEDEESAADDRPELDAAGDDPDVAAALEFAAELREDDEVEELVRRLDPEDEAVLDEEDAAAPAGEEASDEAPETGEPVALEEEAGEAGIALEGEAEEGAEESAPAEAVPAAASGDLQAEVREREPARYIQGRGRRVRRRGGRGERGERGERGDRGDRGERGDRGDREPRGADPATGAAPAVEARAAAEPAPRQDDRRGGRDRDRDKDRDRDRDRERGSKPPLPSISDLLKEGQEIIVQIAKEPLGQKGARITSHIAMPGRYVVYMPTLDHWGVSRKISTDEERQRLKKILQTQAGTMTGGFIVRTAGEGKAEADIIADMTSLYNQWLDIRRRAEKRPAPCLLHHDLELVTRTLRDQVGENFRAIWADSEEMYEGVVSFLERFQPALVPRVKMYTREAPVFDTFNVTSELEKALRPKVWLKSGGYIVINQTEALVAIDINTGKYVGKSNRLEDTIVKTNVEAVKEIVRQVRLRDLGGIIVVDFIDMDERKNRQKVMQALEEAMRADRAPYKILQFNDFGLVAITRRRVKQSLERQLCQPCPTCEGAGYVKSVQTVLSEIITEARKIAPGLEGKDVMLRVNPEVAKLLKGGPENYLEELEEILGRTLIVKSDSLLHPEKFDLG